MTKKNGYKNTSGSNFTSFPFLLSIADKHNYLTPSQLIIASRISSLEFMLGSLKHFKRLTHRTKNSIYADINVLVQKGVIFKETIPTEKDNFSRCVYVSAYDNRGNIKPLSLIMEQMENGVSQAKQWYSDGVDVEQIFEYYF